MTQKRGLDPFFWAVVILVASQALAFYISFRERVFFEENRILSPDLSIGFPLVYFFSGAAILGIVLFLLPVSKLKYVLRGLFTFLFSWSVFLALAFTAPATVSVPIAVIAGLAWLIRPVVWLHNLLLISSMSAAGAVFGFMFSPWTFMVFMLIVAVYDILAVRFGYMLWLADKLSESDTLPAFIIPKAAAGWKQSLRRVKFGGEEDGETVSEFSILGGGDIALPLVLVVSVFFGDGLAGSLVMSAFSVIGLAGAYGIQRFILKGKPVPAIPPLAVACLAGLLLLRLF